MRDAGIEQGNMLRILVVDDEQSIVEVISTFLESEGYEVVTADSGASLMARLDDGIPHIILLDIRMPDIDGIQCLRQIKEKYGSVEVVMMSGFATLQMARKSLEIGAFDYLRKPISFAHLKEVIEHIKITKFLEFM